MTGNCSQPTVKAGKGYRTGRFTSAFCTGMFALRYLQSTKELHYSLFLFSAKMTGTYLQFTAGAQPSQQSANYAVKNNI